MDNATRCPQAHSHHSQDELTKGEERDRGTRRPAATEVDCNLPRNRGCGRGLPPVWYLAADIAEVAAPLRCARRGRPERAEPASNQLASEEGQRRCGTVGPLPAPRTTPRREADPGGAAAPAWRAPVPGGD